MVTLFCPPEIVMSVAMGVPRETNRSLSSVEYAPNCALTLYVPGVASLDTKIPALLVVGSVVA